MNYKICQRCVMDNNGDSQITFEPDGTCNYCNYALKRIESGYFPNDRGRELFNNAVALMKKKGKKQKYDCMMGLSGGLDSSYIAYLFSRAGVRILAIHIDDGFNTPLAKKNIENLCKNCNIELIVVKPNCEEFVDLTRSFILAGLPNICVPQDNILFKNLNDFSKNSKTKFNLSGANLALESIQQRENFGNPYDKTHILHIHKKFGRYKLKQIKIMGLVEKYIGQKLFSKQKTLRPLNWIDYNRERAIKELEAIGFYYYESKHSESYLTKFMQSYYMPAKFNTDVRKSHLSGLIVSGQLTREEALVELKKNPCENLGKEELDFIINKLNFTKEQFDEIMKSPPKKHSDYKQSFFIKFEKTARKFRRFLAD